MKADTTNQHALSSLLEDIVKKLASSINQINDQHQALEKHHKDIIDRQDALTYKHGGEHVKPSDIVCLNVRGTELFARRGTLTVVKGSRLEALSAVARRTGFSAMAKGEYLWTSIQPCSRRSWTTYT